MLDTIVGELPDDIGNVLSPIIKLLVAGFGTVITFAMLSKYIRKRRENPADTSIIRRNMVILLAIYTLSAFVASLDGLLGLRNVPYENAFIGVTISQLFIVVANTFYFWFVLVVLYTSLKDESKRRAYLRAFFLIDFGSASSILVLKMIANPMFLIPSIAHGAATGFLFLLVLPKVFSLKKIVPDGDERKKIKSIGIASCFGLAALILFTIDSLSSHVTIFSLAGSVSLLALCYFISRGYY